MIFWRSFLPADRCSETSSHHRTADIRRDLWRPPGPSYVPSTVIWRRPSRFMSSFHLTNTPRRESSWPTWATRSTAWSPFSEKRFPWAQREPPVFLAVCIVSGSVTSNHWKEPGSTLFAPSLQVFISIDEILSLLLYRTKGHSSLSLSSDERCSSPLSSFVVLSWTLSRMLQSSPCLSCTGKPRPSSLSVALTSAG